MPAPVLPMLEGFFATYVDCLQRSDVADEQAEFVELLDFYAGQAPPRRALRAAVRGSRTELRPSLFAGEFEQQLVEPFAFKPFHEVGARARAREHALATFAGTSSRTARVASRSPPPLRAPSPLFSPAAVSDARARAQAVTEPHDYYALNKRFMRPLVDTADSRLVGEENFRKMQAQLAAGENVVLLSNHQTEADPSAFTALLDPLDDGACFCFRV